MKGILKHLLLTLSCYNDRKSRRAVHGVIEALARYQLEKMIKPFLTIVGKVGEQHKIATPR